MRRNGFAPILILIVVLVIGVVLYFSVKSRNNYFSRLIPSPKSSEVPKSKGTPVNPYDKTYVSKNLGISFKYNSCDNSAGFISEIGNSIYYKQNRDDDLGSAHKIQVFNKSPNLTLVEAINNNLLKNYNRSQCFAISSNTYPKAPNGWDEAEVSYPPDKNTMDPDSLPKCDANYQKTNEVRAFWMNRYFPSKYLFLDLGQSILGCDGAEIDYQSITFIK